MLRLWPALVSLAAFASNAAANPLDAAPFSSEPAELSRLFDGRKHDANQAIAIALESVHYRFDKRGNYVFRLHRIYKILNSRGANGWDYVVRSYAPWYQATPELQARVIAPDGTAVELDRKSIAPVPTRSGSPHTYSDYRQIKGPLPAIAPGSIVEETAVIRTTRPFFAAGDVRWHTVEQPAPTRLFRLTIDAPSAMPIRVARAGATKTRETIRRRRGRTVRAYVAQNVPARPDSEGYLPYDEPRASYVAFSTGRTWRQVAASYGAVIDRRIAGGPVPDLVNRLPRYTGRNRDEVVEAALALVNDNIRYTGLQLGQAAIVPWTPAETWRRKYGDCKDKATLLVALLRGAGLEADVALLNSGYGSDIRPELPGLGSFDHAIVAVGSGPRMWIDPTSELARANELPRSDQGRWALLARRGTRRPVKTPLAPSSTNRVIETRAIALAEYGPARVVETTRFFGSFERSYRYDFRDTKPADLRKRMTGYVKHQYGSETLVMSHEKPSDLFRPLVLRLEIDGAENMFTGDDKAQVWVWPSIVLDELPDYLTKKDESAKKRARPMQIRRMQREVTYQIAIPEGFRVRTVPEPVAWSVGPLRFATRYTRGPRQITATVSLDTGTGRFAPAEVDELRRKLPALRETSHEIALEHIAAAELAAGRVAAGFAEIRRLIKLHPKEALHHTQLADALLAVGLAGPARKEAERAIALEPRSADALGTLAWVVQHDDLGRPYQRGWQRARAARLYRRAIALAPKEGWLRGNYAILLTRGRHGEALGGDLKEAIAQFRALRAKTDDERYNVNLLEALLFDGQHAAIEKEAAAMDRSVQVSAYRVAAAALLGGERAARRKLSSLGSAAGGHDEIVDNATLLLTRRRRYKLASAVLKLRSRPTTQGSALGRTRRVERNPHPASKPESAVVGLILAFDNGRLGKRARDHLTRRGISAEEMESSKLLVMLRQLMRMFERGGLSAPAARDSIIAMLRMKTKKLSGGAMVDLEVEANARKFPLGSVFVINSRGAHRVVATAANPAGAGGHILTLIDRGDLAGARAWLEAIKSKGSRVTRLYDGLSNKTDPAGLIAAAAAIAAWDAELAGAALVRLRRCPADLPLECGRAIQGAHIMRKQYSRASQAAERSLAAKPKDVAARRMAAWSSVLAGRLERGRELADGLLADDPVDWAALQVRAQIDAMRGDYERARAGLAAHKDASGISSITLNQIAWLGLFTGDTGADAVALADRALAIEQNNDSSILNTRAALQAANGDVAKAHRTLLRSITERGKPDLEPQDWLVHGRIAQALGYRSEARRAYKRVKKDPDARTRGDSVHDLARRWLKTL